MFGPWIETFAFLRSLLPDFSGFKFRLPERLPRVHLSFIMLHYLYLISMTIIGSIIMYGSRNIAYIDSLFLSSGAATQSGLNSININDMLLYQQVTMMFIACLTNPIFINTFVVFVRLYWFEKRFQHVVLEAQRFRRTRERSRTKSQAKEDDILDHSTEERGVGNRKIVVMHPGDRTMSIAEHPRNRSKEPMVHEKDTASIGEASRTPSDSETQPSDSTRTADDMMDGPFDAKKDDRDHNLDNAISAVPARREIMFADEVGSASRTGTDLSQMRSAQMSEDDHIAFLKEQKNPTEKKTLYIPGPRDFDRGDIPEEIDDHEDIQTIRKTSNAGIGPRRNSMDIEKQTEDRENLRKKLGKRLSFEDGKSALVKAKTGMVSALRPVHTDGSGEDPEKFPDLQHTHPESTKRGPTLRRRGRSGSFARFRSQREAEVDPMPYLSYQATIGRNSTFVNLSEEQREELGGIEYRALKTLASTLCCYYIGFHLFGMLCLLPYILRDTYEGGEVVSYGVNRVWWGFFTPASMFNDLGFTLTPNSMNGFALAVWPLLVGSFLIIIGNTGFPCMLRFVIWVTSLMVPKGTSLWEEYRFLLDHPRRCFTLLFPATATWWLFWVLVILNGLDLIFFIILDLGDNAVSLLPPGFRVLDGLFQAASTRTAGFSVINLAELHPGVQVSYLIMMYISVFPIAISIRRTNVYEEKSLGVYHSSKETDENGPTQSYIGNHLRRQLSFDLWYVFLGLFIICIVEGNRIADVKDPDFTIFNVLFEVVSAYGTVGLSLGYPGTDASFSSQFHVLSKLVIVAMQLRGRHRGLPYALDRAILLPSDEHAARESDTVEHSDRRHASHASPRGSYASAADDLREGNSAGPRSVGTGDLTEGSYPVSSGNTSRTLTRDTSGSSTGRRKGNGFFRLVGQALGVGPAKND